MFFVSKAGVYTDFAGAALDGMIGLCIDSPNAPNIDAKTMNGDA